jgi:hypothetical protein
MRYTKSWNNLDFEKHHYEYAIMRAGNLSRELIAGFDNDIELTGYDVALVADALDAYGHKIGRSETEVEAHCSKDIKSLLCLLCRKMSVEVQEDGVIQWGRFDWGEKKLAARALESFADGWLKEQIDKLPLKPALAA